MLVSMRGILADADSKNYAVMACNCCNMENVEAVVAAASSKRSAVIINISPRQFHLHADLAAMVPMIVNLASAAPVPIALNLDHGKEYDDIVAALNAGFTSIMFDGSALTYEANLDITKQISVMAHNQGCACEGELGHVGQASAGDGEKTDYFTNVDLAVQFVKETKVDALAVAIGTAHGKYPAGFVPKLDFARLKELKSALRMPLVLHGGSGSGEENIRKAVDCGINKINVCTDVFAVGRDSVARTLASNPSADWLDLMSGAQRDMQAYIEYYMDLIGSSGRYQYTLADKQQLD